MRICLVGKFPPITGGVSTRTYAYAHALARNGHDVDVVTNAKEVGPPYRMFMREEDWARCEGIYDRGSVRVHWTDPFDSQQFHIPTASPFITKLASLGMEVARTREADVVFSFYAEPYAIAGHLIADALQLPHVVRTAGSDAGRLWRHPQFKPLYDHVFRSATTILAVGTVADKMREIGIAPERVRPMGAYHVDEDTFSPETAALDVQGVLDACRADPSFAPLCWGRFQSDRRYIGVYGKLGDRKGTTALLRALAQVKAHGLDIGLLVMGHAPPHATKDYRALALSLGLADDVVQIPFLPNWRVPEFIRRCLAVCCLEQGFPITFHAPIVAHEVLASGACLVASTEILRKLPFADHMVNGYNAVAVNDVDDAGELAERLAAILTRPDLVPVVGNRARELVKLHQRDIAFPLPLERALEDAVSHPRMPEEAFGSVKRSGRQPHPPMPHTPPDPAPESTVPMAPTLDPLFRLTSDTWALEPEKIKHYIPVLRGEIEITSPGAAAADAAVAPEEDGMNRAVIDAQSAAILGLCDGSRTVGEIAALISPHDRAHRRTMRAVSNHVLRLFELGVLQLQSTSPGPNLDVNDLKDP